MAAFKSLSRALTFSKFSGVQHSYTLVVTNPRCLGWSRCLPLLDFAMPEAPSARGLARARSGGEHARSGQVLKKKHCAPAEIASRAELALAATKLCSSAANATACACTRPTRPPGTGACPQHFGAPAQQMRSQFCARAEAASTLQAIFQRSQQFLQGWCPRAAPRPPSHR